MAEDRLFNRPIGPLRRWLTKDQCESMINSVIPGAGAVGLGLAGFVISPFPFGGSLALASLGAGTGSLIADRTIEEGFCKRCKSK